jgi:uncharacterized protein (TIGR03086 family)
MRFHKGAGVARACEDDSMIPDSLAALDLASEAFRLHLAVVRDEDWTAATPCTDWDVHYLVAHVVGGNRFASMVLNGRTAAEAMEVVMGAAQLGADPLGDFDTSADDQRRQFRRAAALDQQVSHPLGVLSGERFLGMRVFDIAVHSWDLAVAIGRNAELDDELVEAVLQIVRQEALAMAFGIEPCGDVGPDASPMEQLLDLSGRCANPGPA